MKARRWCGVYLTYTWYESYVGIVPAKLTFGSHLNRSLKPETSLLFPLPSLFRRTPPPILRLPSDNIEMHFIHQSSLRIASVSIFFVFVLHVNSPAVALFCSHSSYTITLLGTSTSSRQLSNDHRTRRFLPHHGTSSMQQHPRRCHHMFHLAPQQLGEFEEISFADDEEGRAITRNLRRVWLYDFVATTEQQSSPDARTMPYHETWDLQKRLVDYQLARIGKRPKDPPLYCQFVPNSDDMDGNATPPHLLGCDSIIIVQHDPVYTLGTASDPSFILGYDDHDNYDNKIPIYRIERGGEVTYHGPGQLTVYPILDLRGYKQDIHWYMRALEEVILLALKKAGVKGVCVLVIALFLDLRSALHFPQPSIHSCTTPCFQATREDSLTGVWVSNKKIAALGIKARRWVTMHGVAINVDMRSLQNFDGIVPCGLEGREVTCINEEIDSAPYLTVEEFSHLVKEALEEIFGVCLIPVQ